jgi:C1A family cysteine protease
MKKYIGIALVGAFFLLAFGLAHSDETKTYPCGTFLLFREYKVPVTLVPMRPDEEKSLRPSFDWGPTARNPLGRNIASPVRDQGVCGSCWAFGTVACLESWANAIYGLSSVDLSEEVLVSDCCPAGDCGGGFMHQASDWLVNIGTTTENCWPYTAINGPCNGYCPNPILVKTQSWDYACDNWWTIDIEQIKQALIAHGPLAVGMEVYTDFYDYSGGVYRRTWGENEGGHSILLTGYVDAGSVPGGGYFIAKNSWGPDWGPYGGYFAVAYDSNCMFGIQATYYNWIQVSSSSAMNDPGS